MQNHPQLEPHLLKVWGEYTAPLRLQRLTGQSHMRQLIKAAIIKGSVLTHKPCKPSSYPPCGNKRNASDQPEDRDWHQHHRPQSYVKVAGKQSIRNILQGQGISTGGLPAVVMLLFSCQIRVMSVHTLLV